MAPAAGPDVTPALAADMPEAETVAAKFIRLFASPGKEKHPQVSLRA